MRCSVALISSWERRSEPPTPSAQRLADYATFFSTGRSVERRPYRVLGLDELTDAERARRSELEQRLIELRTAAVSGDEHEVPGRSGVTGRGPWHFPDADPDRPVVIVCPELPAEQLAAVPHSDPTDPDFSELYRLTDLDALLELHGHIRAVNPDARVEYRNVTNLRRDDVGGDLVVLGGVDWNAATSDVLRRTGVPIAQVPQDDPMYRGSFQVAGEETRTFAPVIDDRNGRRVLVEDVGHFYRGPNPFNAQRTVTLCNGVFGRGVLGAVRALTDREFRDKNTEYLERQFGDDDSYSLLFRVTVFNERVVATPDWTTPPCVLHTWSEKS